MLIVWLMKKRERVKFVFRFMPRTPHSHSLHTRKTSRTDAIFWKITIIMAIGTRFLPTSLHHHCIKTSMELASDGKIKPECRTKSMQTKSVNSNIYQQISSRMTIFKEIVHTMISWWVHNKRWHFLCCWRRERRMMMDDSVRERNSPENALGQ